MGKNLISFDTSYFSRTIQKDDPSVASVAVKKHYPHSLTVKVNFRSPLVYIKQNELYYVVDSAGVVYETLKEMPSDRVELGISIAEIHQGDMLEEQIVKNVLPAVQVTKNEGINISKIEIRNLRAEFLLTNGIRVYLPTFYSKISNLSSLQTIINSFRIEKRSPKIIDYRFDKPVVIF